MIESKFTAGKIKYANQLFRKHLICKKREWQVEARVWPSGKVSSNVFCRLLGGWAWASPEHHRIEKPVKIQNLEKKLLKDAENYRELYSEEIEAEIKFHQEPKISIHTRSLPQGVPKPDDYEVKAKKLIAFYRLAPELLEALEKHHKAVDWLLARVIELDNDFKPTKSPVWDSVSGAYEIMKKATET